MANPDGLDLWYKQGTFNYLRLYGEDRQNPISGWLYVDEGSVVTKAMTEHLAHADLSDMPDVGGTNTDHDARYYTETEMVRLYGVGSNNNHNSKHSFRRRINF